MRVRFKGRRNPFAFLFARSGLEDYLARYLLAEYARGRSLQDVLNDPYLRNRATPEERARLLERPEVVATIGRKAVADLRLALADARADPRTAPATRAGGGSDARARVRGRV
jgi:hypothetical protein